MRRVGGKGSQPCEAFRILEEILKAIFVFGKNLADL